MVVVLWKTIYSLLFSLTGIDYQGLKYFWERWAVQYIPRRTHKILDLIGPTPHKYLFVETEFSWCLKLCYYILTTYIHILQYIGKFRVCAIWISTGNYFRKHSKRHNHTTKFTKYVFGCQYMCYYILSQNLMLT